MQHRSSNPGGGRLAYETGRATRSVSRSTIARHVEEDLTVTADQSIQSKIIAMAFSMAAEIERDLISQHTQEALRFKKAQGMKLGRPKGLGKSKLDQYRPEIESLLANGSTQKFIARRYKTTGANLSNWMKKNGVKASKGVQD
jgi:DNA invertase Pin-like site-specific DNA recombinase